MFYQCTRSLLVGAVPKVSVPFTTAGTHCIASFINFILNTIISLWVRFNITIEVE